MWSLIKKGLDHTFPPESEEDRLNAEIGRLLRKRNRCYVQLAEYNAEIDECFRRIAEIKGSEVTV